MPLTIDINSRDPRFEGVISLDPYLSYRYAKEILKKRWRRGEAAVISCPYTSYKYAKHVIGGRWPVAEKSIAKDARASFLYARDMVGGRWPEGEKIMASPFDPDNHFQIRKLEDIYIHPSLLRRRKSNPSYPVGNQDVFHFAGEYYALLLRKKEPEKVLNNFLAMWRRRLLKYPKAISIHFYPEESHELHNAMVLLQMNPHDEYERDWIRHYFKDRLEEAEAE